MPSLSPLSSLDFIKSRAHSPRPASKIIGMIALRHAILMKADLLVGLHAHRLFSGRACSCFLKQSLRDFLLYVILAIPYLRARTKETSSLPNDSMRPCSSNSRLFPAYRRYISAVSTFLNKRVSRGLLMARATRVSPRDFAS